MATMTSTYAWLHDATDYTDQLQIECRSWPSTNPGMAGAVRRRAGGRTQAVGTVGITHSVPLSVVIDSADKLGWLEAHIGHLVLARSQWGDRVWGVYYSVDYTRPSVFEFPFAATVTIVEVTTTEVV